MKKTFGDVYTGILLIMIAGTFLNPQYFFIVSIGFYLVRLVKSGFKMVIPCVPGFKLYMAVILYGTIAGLFVYSTRNVVRDLYYVLPTVLWILIGANAAVFRNEKDLIKTLFLYGAFVSIKSAVMFIAQFTLDFSVLRIVFGPNVYDVGFILPVTIVQIFLHKRVYISKSVDRLFVVLMAMQIILSLGRMAILEPVLIAAVLIIMESKTAEHKKYLGRIAKLLFAVVIVFFMTFYILPDSVKYPLLDKVINSVSEIDASQEILSVGEAMNNWRAYEIQAAQEQWRASGVLTRIFGGRLGKGIELQYVPFNWDGVVENNEIPLLHNGFYTILTKGGILGIVALLWIFAGSYIKGYRMTKYVDARQCGMIMMAISVAGVANTYVVRGPIQQGTFLVWAVLLGWTMKKGSRNCE